ncbi:pemK-like protein [bacterium BMS3Abin02]|nr:pemK-like protein [bacterium BMS3Abin02]GBE20853.1 pemK-like protein [bacterium BMS3Bbin01]HDH27049.1 type II toxin-antitoxin system PemK/MazF family toxin [Actinomycetota bacterium]
MVDTPAGDKPFVVVSNQQRNRSLDTVLCARITTSPKRPSLPSVVPIEDRSGAVVGRVLCDDVLQLDKGQLLRRTAAFAPREMSRICDGLNAALACT